MTKLVLLQGGEATPFDLAAGETVLGRHPDCTLQLESNMVSRRHARVFSEDDAYFVEDLGSGNGTFVNGKRIEQRTPLKHDDRIKLGPILLRFETQESSAPTSIPSADVLGATDAFNLDITSEEDDSSTIVSSAENASGFGMLDVRPEVKLKAVLDITRSLAGTVDLETLLPKILNTLFEIFPHADRGSLLIRNAQSGQMLPAAQKQKSRN